MMDWLQHDHEVTDDGEQHPRRRKPRPAVALSLSMTAMIDVVFLLLIYFVVATDFRMGEGVYRIDVPNVDGSAPTDPFKLDEEPLRIVVTSTGLSPEMYRLRIDGSFPQPATFDDLHDFLNRTQVNEVNIAAESGALFAPNHPIIVQPSRITRWEHAIEAFNAAARARYINVTFAKPG